MGGGMSSRLFQEIREKRGMCYSIFTQAGAYSDTGMTMMYAGTSAEQIEELALVCMDEMKRAADDISEAEVNRARAQMKAGLLMGLESPSSRAERMARVLQIWDRIPDLSETIEKIDAVDVASVRAFGGKLITDTKMAMVLYGPVKGAPQLETLKQRLAA
jgi:predicted Zn-dependent peptidase